ncbi:MAG: hypothetical protein QXI35_06195 [Candidatus Nezhaarchaeales archaeon]
MVVNMRFKAMRYDGKCLEIEIDDELVRYLQKEPFEYRVCTDCCGPVILPIELKPPKESDYIVDLGSKKLYISSIQALWIRRLTMDMLRESCCI